MQTQLERVMRRLTTTERMVVLVGTIVMAAMLSAIVVDRWLARQVVPVVITLAPSAGVSGDASILK